MKKQLSIFRRDSRIEMLAKALDVKIVYRGEEDGWLYTKVYIVGKKKHVKKFVKLARENFLAKPKKPRNRSVVTDALDALRYSTYSADKRRLESEVNNTHGKTVSDGPGVFDEASDTEADRVLSGEDEADRGEDGYLPDEDTRRPAGPGLHPKKPIADSDKYKAAKNLKEALEGFNGIDASTGAYVSYLLAPEADDIQEPPLYEQPTEELTLSQFAVRYRVPVAMVTSWALRKDGPIRTIYYRDPKEYQFDYCTKILPDHLYPYKDPLAGKYTRWEWLEWDEYCQKRKDWSSWNAWKK